MACRRDCCAPRSRLRPSRRLAARAWLHAGLRTLLCSRSSRSIAARTAACLLWLRSCNLRLRSVIIDPARLAVCLSALRAACARSARRHSQPRNRCARSSLHALLAALAIVVLDHHRCVRSSQPACAAFFAVFVPRSQRCSAPLAACPPSSRLQACQPVRCLRSCARTLLRSSQACARRRLPLNRSLRWLRSSQPALLAAACPALLAACAPRSLPCLRSLRSRAPRSLAWARSSKLILPLSRSSRRKRQLTTRTLRSSRSFLRSSRAPRSLRSSRSSLRLSPATCALVAQPLRSSQLPRVPRSLLSSTQACLPRARRAAYLSCARRSSASMQLAVRSSARSLRLSSRSLPCALAVAPRSSARSLRSTLAACDAPCSLRSLPLLVA
jgi:hypothetical protein